VVTSYAKNGAQRIADTFLWQTLIFCRQKSSKYLNCSVQPVQVWLFPDEYSPTS
jgi:hypothetical protein